MRLTRYSRHKACTDELDSAIIKEVHSQFYSSCIEAFSISERSASSLAHTAWPCSPVSSVAKRVSTAYPCLGYESRITPCPLWNALRSSGSPCYSVNIITAQPLYSAGITLRRRSYGPLRLPLPQVIRLLIPWHLFTLSTSERMTRKGYPRYHDCSFDARSPQSPRPSWHVQTFISSMPVAGFTISGRIANGNLA